MFNPAREAPNQLLFIVWGLMLNQRYAFAFNEEAHLLVAFR